MTPDHQARTRRCRCGKHLPDSAPVGGPVHLCGPDRRWIDQLLTSRERTSRRQVQSGPMHAAKKRYAADTVMVASLLAGAAQPANSRTQHTNGRSPGPSNPTEAVALARLERVEWCMVRWAHLYAPCPCCPACGHHEADHVGQLVDVDTALVDNLCALSILSASFGQHLEALNMAQQQAAEDVWDGWRDAWKAGAEPDVLRAATARMSRLAGRMRWLVRHLGGKPAREQQDEDAA